MKDLIKLAGILFLGLLTAVFIYPFLHETGHSAAALLLGTQVLEFNLLPFPNVLCNMTSISKIGIAFTGLNGTVFPIAFSFVISRLSENKSFWIWYITFILNGIGLLSTAISVTAVFLFNIGRPIANEDITQILQFIPNSSFYVLLLMTAIAVRLIIKIKSDKPIKKCLAYFEETKTKSDTE